MIALATKNFEILNTVGRLCVLSNIKFIVLEDPYNIFDYYQEKPEIEILITDLDSFFITPDKLIHQLVDKFPKLQIVVFTEHKIAPDLCKKKNVHIIDEPHTSEKIVRRVLEILYLS